MVSEFWGAPKEIQCEPHIAILNLFSSFVKRSEKKQVELIFIIFFI